jgi:hypothetical protein
LLNRNDVEPFTVQEVKVESARGELDGFLVGYAAKEAKVKLGGVGSVDGQTASKCKLTTEASHVQPVWIDAQSDLEGK